MVKDKIVEGRPEYVFYCGTLEDLEQMGIPETFLEPEYYDPKDYEPEYCDIKKYVEKLGLNDHIRFLGNRADVGELYQAMDVFVMPSYYEGFPVVGVEAQAAGLLCLFADTITSEIKISPKAFFVSLDEGIENWANRIEQMLRSQSERNNLILEHERFDITKNANKLDRFYRRRIEDLK